MPNKVKRKPIRKKPRNITERPLDTGKRLTLSEKILIRAEKDTGQSKLAVARKYGVSDNTVKAIWNDGKLSKMKSQVAVVKKAMTDKLYLTANSCIDQVEFAVEFASAKDAAISAGIMIEKARLFENKSTQNHSLQGYLNICNKTPV